MTKSQLQEIESATSLAIPDREDDERLARELHQELYGLARKSLRIAYKLGGILESLKQEIPHGKWEGYVRNHLGIEPRTASNYTRIRREAMDIGRLGEILKSENISDLGVREVLDMLAASDRKIKGGSTSSHAAKGQKESKSSEGKKACRQPSSPALRLADGSHIDLKRLGWKDGLLSQAALENWIGSLDPGAGGAQSNKLEARRQRAVVEIAAGINKACGRADRPAALELVDSAISIIQQLLKETAKPQSPPHPPE